MSVFDADVQTPLAVADPRTDWKLPPPGSLLYSSITTDTALSGVNGHDTLLLSGNRDRHMTGNENTVITQNRSHTVQGNQQKQIAGNKNENIVGNFNHQTTGNLSRTTVGATNDAYTGCHTIAHKDDQKIQEPTSYYHDVKDFFEKHNSHMDDYIDYQLHAVAVQNFIGHNLDIKAVQNAVIGMVAEKHFICAAEKDVETKLHTLKHKVALLKSEIGAIEPVVYVTKIHEVSITQKLIVVGFNQFM